MLKWIALLALAFGVPGQAAVVEITAQSPGYDTIYRCPPWAGSDCINYYTAAPQTFVISSEIKQIAGTDQWTFEASQFIGSMTFRGNSFESLAVTNISEEGSCGLGSTTAKGKAFRTSIPVCDTYDNYWYYRGQVVSVYLDGTKIGIVPEPSTWALLILGFGAIGAALRRNRPSRAVRADAGRGGVPRAA